MPNLTLHSRPRASSRAFRQALPGLLSIALLACGSDDPSAIPQTEQTHQTEAEPRIALSMTYDFAAHVEVATVDGKFERQSNGMAQYAGATATFHFLLPQHARLTGHAAAHGEIAQLQIDLLSDGGGERTLVQCAVAPGSSGFTLDSDLSEYAGEMLAVRFSTEAAPETEHKGARLDWTGLGIESPVTSPANVFAGARRRYNVVVIVFDSLRPDFTAPYGDDSIKTPNLARLAEQGVTFVNARSSANWTRASIAAMFTSLEPEASGVLALGDQMPESGSYLPEALQREGYRTLALTNNAMLSNAFGFERGFDRVVELFRQNPKAINHESAEFRAGYAWRNFIKPVVEAADPRPFFVYLHELDPHSPYDAPAPYNAMDEFGYEGDVATDLRGLQELRLSPGPSDKDDIREIRRRYRAEISFMDHYLGFVMQRLEKGGHEADTLLIFASDHGEEFREHGDVGHGVQVYEEQLRVPLVMRLPGVLPAGARVEADARLIDVPKTLFDLLGIEADASLRGESLLVQVANPGDDPARVAYGNSLRDTSSVGLGKYKLVRTGGESETIALYDLSADPGETHDIAADHPVVVGTLMQLHRVNRHGARQPPAHDAAPPSLDDVEPGVIENLRALGYVE